MGFMDLSYQYNLFYTYLGLWLKLPTEGPRWQSGNTLASHL